jgi:hypothetical protein
MLLNTQQLNVGEPLQYPGQNYSQTAMLLTPTVCPPIPYSDIYQNLKNTQWMYLWALL